METHTEIYLIKYKKIKFIMQSQLFEVIRYP